MVSRLILNLRNQASRPHRPKTAEFASFFSAYPVSYASTGAVPSLTHGHFPTDRQHLVSTIIGNLGEPVEFDWFDDPEGFETPVAGTSAAGDHGSSRGHGFDSEGGTQEGFEYDDDDAKLDSPSARRCEGMTEQFELAVARTPTRTPIVVEVTVTRAESAVSRADGALPRFSISGDVRSIGSGTGSAISVGGCDESTLVSPTSAQGLLDVPLPPDPPLLPPSPLRGGNGNSAETLPRSPRRPRTGTGAGPVSAWRPPQAWNLEEGVDVTELGRPRKASRRPRTS